MWVLYEVYDMSKPEPLDLEDIVSKWESFFAISFSYGDSGYAIICSFVIKDLKQIIQRIKKSCLFYDRYKGFNGMKKLTIDSAINEVELNKEEKVKLSKFYSKYIKILERENFDELPKLVNKYNEWLFKLAFKGVFKKEKNLIHEDTLIKEWDNKEDERWNKC